MWFQRFVNIFVGTSTLKERCERHPKHGEEPMMSRMNLVENAARLAMADHRAATPRRLAPRSFWQVALAMFAGLWRKPAA
jgi:hypothetical protein